MTTTDYLINAALVLLVIRQARERRLDLRGLVVPIALVGLAGQHYIQSVPTGGNDIPFALGLAVLGGGLGVLSGQLTDLRNGPDGSVYARVGWLAGGVLLEIAGRLVVSPATVKTHVNRIFYKTGARDRAQAVRYAYEHGIA